MRVRAPAKTFIDTNILIYAHDVDAARKHNIARGIVVDLLMSRSAVLSPQVLQEFYVNVTRKIPKPLTKRAARMIVDDFSVCCIDTTATEVSAAFQIEDESQISFRDALICASARKARAQVILSEDLNAGQTIAGTRIENPFD
jgi:predicted nucleic acid-binding protein